MLTTQQVFNRVVNGGFYTQEDGLMCHSLKTAARQGFIAKEEFIQATAEIREYLSGFGSLGGFLSYKDQPYDFNSRLSIYLDWDNKPSFKK